MRNLLSGLVSGAGLVILWAMLTKPKQTMAWTSDWFDTNGLQPDGMELPSDLVFQAIPLLKGSDG